MIVGGLMADTSARDGTQGLCREQNLTENYDQSHNIVEVSTVNNESDWIRLQSCCSVSSVSIRHVLSHRPTSSHNAMYLCAILSRYNVSDLQLK